MHYKNMSDQQVIKALTMCGMIAENTAKTELTKHTTHEKHGENDYISTGNLRNSITYTVDYANGGGEMRVGSIVHYAPYVELGTGIYYEGGRQTPWVYQDSQGHWHTTNGMQERPFLRPAIQNNIQKFRDTIEKVLKNG